MKQLEFKGFINHDWKIKIDPDDWQDNPREWSNIGKIFTSNNCRYVENETNINFDDFTSGNLENDVKQLEKKGYIVFIVSVYDHSGVKIYLGDPCDRWDSGIIGFYIIDRAEVKKDFNIKRITKKFINKLENYAAGELETLTSYINGEVYNYSLFKDGDLVDSCGGFYGLDSFKYMFENMPEEFTKNYNMQEAESLAEWNY